MRPRGVHITEAEVARILADFDANPNSTLLGLAQKYGASQETIRRLLGKAGRKWRHDGMKGESRERDAAIEHWRPTLDKLRAEAYEGLYVDPVIKTRLPCKLLFAPDSHGNYWDPSVTEEMLRRDGDATLVVTNEIITADAFSHFRQEYDTDMVGEFLVTGGFVEMLRGKAGGGKRRQVVISNSNHQERFIKFVSDNAKTPDAVNAAAKMYEAGMREFVGVKRELTSAFVVQVGRALFGHPDSYLTTQGGTAARLLQRNIARYPEYGLEPPFEFVAIGHPHRLNLNQASGSRAFVAEAGCQCHVPRYAVRDNSTRPCTLFPMVNGYVTVTLDKTGHVENFGVQFIKFATVPGREQ